MSRPSAGLRAASASKPSKLSRSISPSLIASTVTARGAPSRNAPSPSVVIGWMTPLGAFTQPVDEQVQRAVALARP